MKEHITKAYMYSRVSTAMQVDGYSLDAQKERIRAYAKAMNMELVGEYEDAGRSGKSIGCRPEFQRMINDIEDHKDNVSYVLVFKLSRFGRNAADTLSTLQIMQDHGVNLICVEDGIDSAKEAGKLVLTVMSAVAEMERENIAVQTMEGRRQKAREGKWNGGPAPFGYRLKDGNLIVDEEEAKIVHIIFDKYVNEEIGIASIVKWLNDKGYKKATGKVSAFSESFLSKILENPVYYGMIAYGRRPIKKVAGTRDTYHRVQSDNYALHPGKHESIISEELWTKAQRQRKKNREKYHQKSLNGQRKIHLISGLLKCPCCGSGMYANKCIKKKNGKVISSYHYYYCKNQTGTTGISCTYSSQINEEKLNRELIEIIGKVVARPEFSGKLKSQISISTNISAINSELEVLEKKRTSCIQAKKRIEAYIDQLDYDDRYYEKKLADLEERLRRKTDELCAISDQIEECRKKKAFAEQKAISTEKIYEALVNFEKVFPLLDARDQRDLMVTFIKDVFILPTPSETGRRIKSIVFNFPVIGDETQIGLDTEQPVETVILMTLSVSIQ